MVLFLAKLTEEWSWSGQCTTCIQTWIKEYTAGKDDEEDGAGGQLLKFLSSLSSSCLDQNKCNGDRVKMVWGKAYGTKKVSGH